jgi:ubiquinone/menaquinone biosynthesis C-methylase UbiE
MERLSLNSKPTNPDIEAAIHCARYAIAKNVVSGKKVLDVACGEGYGSYLLKNSGAHDVLGIDISDDVIKSCRKNYESEGIRFIAGSAEDLPELLGDEKFDVIVCIETIEHIADVNMLLKGIKHVLKTDGVVIITCPNDHWYYAEAETQNIYHQRRYTFEEFQQISTNILGKDANWSLGTACLGFVSTPTSVQRQYQQVPNTWFSHINNCGTYVVAENNSVEAFHDNCSYFVGVWGLDNVLVGSAVFAITMDDYVDVFNARNGDMKTLKNVYSNVLEQNESLGRTIKDQENQIQNHLNDERKLVEQNNSLGQTIKDQVNQIQNHLNNECELNEQLKLSVSMQKGIGLRLSAAISENKLLRESLHHTGEELRITKGELDFKEIKIIEMEPGYEKYKKILKIVPKIARRRFSRLLENK